MNRLKLWTKEPTLLIGAVSAVLAFFVTFGVEGLSGEQAGLIVGVVTAILTLINAWAVRPIAPTLFSGLITAGAALLAGYGLELGQEQVGQFQLAVVAVMTLILRGQVMPERTDGTATPVDTTPPSP